MIIPKEDLVDFDYWANSLVIDFPTDNITIFSHNGSWKNWADQLVQENSFSSQGAPTSDLFSDRWEWAMALFKTMANYA
jgi:hypothetical protein